MTTPYMKTRLGRVMVLAETDLLAGHPRMMQVLDEIGKLFPVRGTNEDTGPTEGEVRNYIKEYEQHWNVDCIEHYDNWGNYSGDSIFEREYPQTLLSNEPADKLAHRSKYYQNPYYLALHVILEDQIRTRKEMKKKMATPKTNFNETLVERSTSCGGCDVLLKSKVSVEDMNHYAFGYRECQEHGLGQCLKESHDAQSLPAVVAEARRLGVKRAVMVMPYWKIDGFEQHIKIAFELGRTGTSYNVGVVLNPEPGTYKIDMFGSYSNTGRSIIMADLINEYLERVETDDVVQCTSTHAPALTPLIVKMQRSKKYWNAWMAIYDGLCPLCVQSVTEGPKASARPSTPRLKTPSEKPLTTGASSSTKLAAGRALSQGKLPPLSPDYTSSTPASDTWDDGTADLKIGTYSSGTSSSKPAWKPKGRR
jgi:hypothetical protein